MDRGVNRPQDDRAVRRGAADHEVKQRAGGSMTRTLVLSIVSQAAEVGVFFAAAGVLAAGMLALK